MARYDEKTSAELLRRARELQEQAARVDEQSSLDELKGIASDIGVDPRYVVQAAAELEGPGPRARPGRLQRVLGGPTRFELVRDVDGEPDDATLTAVAEAIQEVMGDVGFLARVGNTVTWTSGQQQIHRISLTIRDGRTRIHAIGAMGDLLGGLYGGIGGGVGFGTITPVVMLGASIGGAPGMILAGVTQLTAVFLLTRAIFGRASRRRADRLQTAVDRIEEVLRTRRSAKV